MSAPPTRLEASRGVVLAWCRDCPPWRRLAGDRAGALLEAAAHMDLTHHDPAAAYELRRQAASATRRASR